MVQDLVIVGAGGSSREIAGAVEDINQMRKTWNVLGFLDDDPSKSDATIDGLRVLGSLDSARTHAQALFVVGIASYKVPSTRRQIVQKLDLPPNRFATIIHPSASLSRMTRLGRGSIVLQNVVITSGTTVGDHVLISQGAQLAHDVVVADYVTLAPAVIVCGAVTIRESAYLGAGAVIAPGVMVDVEALVGIGATVTENVAAGSTVFGNPARTINVLGGPRRWSR